MFITCAISELFVRVIPGLTRNPNSRFWIPAFAGMTEIEYDLSQTALFAGWRHRHRLARLLLHLLLHHHLKCHHHLGEMLLGQGEIEGE